MRRTIVRPLPVLVECHLEHRSPQRSPSLLPMGLDTAGPHELEAWNATDFKVILHVSQAAAAEPTTE